MKYFFALLILLFLSSCTSRKFTESKIFAGGIEASAHVLNRGHDLYQVHCMACHGRDGDGKGVSHMGSKIPPRDLTMGVYKFGQVAAGELPHDEHFYKILREGLKGSSMLPWDLSEGQMFALVQYMKTFAPDTWLGEDKQLGEEIVVIPDPWTSRKDAVDRGRAVYHGEGNCLACHQGYIDLFELNEITEAAMGFSWDELDPQFYEVKPQYSMFGYMVVPPDFTWHQLRLVNSKEDLFVRLSAGVGGGLMPAYKWLLSEEDIWALVHYIWSLRELRGTEKRQDMMDELRSKAGL